MGTYEYNMNAADIQFDGASDHATYASDYTDAVQTDVSTAETHVHHCRTGLVGDDPVESIG